MGKVLTIGLILIILLLVVGVTYYGLGNEDNISGKTVNSDLDSDNPSVYTIEMNENGFSPKTLEIKQGDTVKFVNVGNTGHWPASGTHPVHTEKCGVDDESQIFDACREIQPGESYSFTFNEKGSWSYHDHLNTGLFGKIIVN